MNWRTKVENIAKFYWKKSNTKLAFIEWVNQHNIDLPCKHCESTEYFEKRVANSKYSRKYCKNCLRWLH